MINHLEELTQLFKIVSFEKYLQYSILKYPTLYARGGLEAAELSLLDQLLNVNGNGLQTNQSAAQHYHKALSEISAYSEEEAIENGLRVTELLENKEDYVLGYTQEQLQEYELCKESMVKYEMDVTPLERTLEIRPTFKLAKATYERLKSSAKLPENIAYWHISVEKSIDAQLEAAIKEDPALRTNPELLAEMLEQLKKYAVSRQNRAKPVYMFCPYPNFEKNYSAIYGANLVYQAMTQSSSWKAAMLKFYERCQEYFNNQELRARYHYAYEPEIQPASKRLEDFEKYVAKFASVEEASQALGHPYSGNSHEYLTQSWHRELAQIQAFIVETIDRIKTGAEFV